MKRRGGKSANMYVMVGLLAVLFISLAYLSMQAREGFREGNEEKSDAIKVLDALVKDKDEEEKKEKAGFRMREGFFEGGPGTNDSKAAAAREKNMKIAQKQEANKRTDAALAVFNRIGRP